MSLLTSTAFTQEGKPFGSPTGRFDRNPEYQEVWPDREEVSLTDLVDWSRRFNGKTESNTLLVGQEVGRLLCLDYASLERRAAVLFASGDAGWPLRPKAAPGLTCTRLLEQTPDWFDFQAYVERPEPSLWDSGWTALYRAKKAGWDSFVHKVLKSEIDADACKRWASMPHQTTGEEALDLWKTTAGHFG